MLLFVTIDRFSFSLTTTHLITAFLISIVRTRRSKTLALQFYRAVLISNWLLSFLLNLSLLLRVFISLNQFLCNIHDVFTLRWNFTSLRLWIKLYLNLIHGFIVILRLNITHLSKCLYLLKSILVARLFNGLEVLYLSVSNCVSWSPLVDELVWITFYETVVFVYNLFFLFYLFFVNEWNCKGKDRALFRNGINFKFTTKFFNDFVRNHQT